MSRLFWKYFLGGARDGPKFFGFRTIDPKGYIGKSCIHQYQKIRHLLDLQMEPVDGPVWQMNYGVARIGTSRHEPENVEDHTVVAWQRKTKYLSLYLKGSFLSGTCGKPNIALTNSGLPQIHGVDNVHYSKPEGSTTVGATL